MIFDAALVGLSLELKISGQSAGAIKLQFTKLISILFAQVGKAAPHEAANPHRRPWRKRNHHFPIESIEAIANLARIRMSNGRTGSTLPICIEPAKGRQP
jgi:hypothetical protein